MELHQLRPAKGAVKKQKRLGRGEASGKGGTSTKGNKGQQSDSGYKIKRGHEGGQMPLHRRIPKRGFHNPGRVEFKVFNLGQLDQLIEKYKLQEISCEALYLNGLIGRTDKVKILGQGQLKSGLPFRVNAVSDKAKQLIEAAGGSISLV